MTAPILQPVAVLIAWSMVMWLWLYVARIPALMRNPDYDARGSVGSVGADIRPMVPKAVQWKADNYNHLMEQPTLFYAVALLLALVGAGHASTQRSPGSMSPSVLHTAWCRRRSTGSSSASRCTSSDRSR